MKKPRRGSVRGTSAPQPAESADDGVGITPPAVPSTSVASESVPTASSAISDDDIRRRAYELYESRNGVEGDSLSDWLTAEQELRKLSSI